MSYTKEQLLETAMGVNLSDYNFNTIEQAMEFAGLETPDPEPETLAEVAEFGVKLTAKLRIKIAKIILEEVYNV